MDSVRSLPVEGGRPLRAGPTYRLGKIAGRIVLYLAVLALAAVFAVPLVWLVSSSLKPVEEVFDFPPRLIPSRIVWENYTEALGQFPFVRALVNTVKIVFGVMVGRLLTASLAAYAFARLRFPLRGPLFMVVLGTLMIPFHVTLIPQFLLFRQLGWTDSAKPLIVPAFFGGGAFYIFLLRQFFLTIPLEMDDAARIDGCGVFGTFWHIILPLSLPALGTVAIYTFMAEWNAFLRPLIFLNSPDKQTLAIALRHWQLGGSSAVGTLRVPWTQIMAMAALITVPPLVTFFATQRYFIQGIVVTGLKG